jgi:hypothetical protein
MPVTFTDERLLSFGARLYREKRPDETIEAYRSFIADSHQKVDPIEAHEIRTGKGWNKWSDPEFGELVAKSPDKIGSNPMVTARIYSKRSSNA